jgi:hypothetical protein
MNKKEINEKIVAQAWALFYHWYHDPNSEQTARVQNSLFERLKESDPDWPDRLDPPALGIAVSDNVSTGEKLS